MNNNKIWKILNLEPTKDETVIKNAYRKQLVHVNPEDNPTGFMELRNAYEEAIKQIHATQEELSSDETELDSWLKELDAIYLNIEKRITIKLWEDLLEQDTCKRLDSWYELRTQVLTYLMDHFYLPNPVWELFNKEFRILDDFDELSNEFPSDFLKYIERQLTNGTFLDFMLFTTSDASVADTDEYIQEYFSLREKVEQKQYENIESAFAVLDSYSSYHPYIDVERMRYFLDIADYEKTEHLIQKLSPYVENNYVAFFVAKSMWTLEKYDDAGALYKTLCDKYENHYGANIGLIEYYYHTKQYRSANETAIALLRQFPQDEHTHSLLSKANEALIPEYTKQLETNPDLFDTKVELCWCLYQNSHLEQCLSVLDSFTKEQKENLVYPKLKGYIYFQLNDYDSTEMYLLQWLQKISTMQEDESYPREFPKSNYLVGINYAANKAYDKAIPYLEIACKTDTDTNSRLTSMERLAYTHLKAENNEDCIDVCNQILEISDMFYMAYLHRQEAYYNLKNGRAVIDDYHHAIELVPNYAKPYIVAAKTYYNYQQYEDAISVINHAKELENTSIELDFLHIKNLRMLAKTADDTNAIVKLSNTLMKQMQSPTDVEEEYTFTLADVYHELAKTYADNKQFDLALEQIRLAIKQDPSNNLYYVTKAYIFVDQERYPEATIQLKQCISHYPNSANLYTKLGDCYLGLENEIQAQYEYEKALILAENSVFIMMKLMDLHHNRYIKHGKFTEYNAAKSYASRILAEEISTYHYIHTGLLYVDGYDLDLALDCYKKARELTPDDIWSYNNSGYALKIQRKYVEAIESFQKAISLMSPKQSHLPHSNLADCYVLTGEYEKALECYDKLIESIPDSMWVYEDKAEVFEKMHLFAQAITLYEKAYSISGADIIDTYFNFAFVYDKMDDFDTGLHYVEKALREDKKRNSSFLRAAEFFFSFRKPDKALQYLSKITTSSNGDFREQFNHRLELSHVYFDLRKYRKAKKAALECIKLIETQYDSINNYTSFYSCRAKRLCHMGVLYMAQLDYQKAEEVLLEAIHCLPCKNCLSTGCYEAFFILGKVYAVQGNYIKAKEQYQKALQYNDNYTICRRQLEQLEKQI